MVGTRNLLVAFLSLVLVSPAIPPAISLEVNAPATVDHGELIVIQTDATVGVSVVWDVIDPVGMRHETFPRVVRETVNDQVVTHAVDDAVLACSSGKQDGLIRISVYAIDWANQKFTKKSISIAVKGATPPGPDPPPPGPDPPPTPTGFRGEVKAALDLIKGSQDKAAAIGGNYRVVAAQAVATPASWDPPAMMDAVKVRHGEVLSVQQMQDWQPFWPPLAKAFVGLKLNTTDLQGHAKAFHDVADVLGAPQ